MGRSVRTRSCTSHGCRRTIIAISATDLVLRQSVLQGREDLDLNLSSRLLFSGAVTRGHALRISQTLADSLCMLVIGLGKKHTSGENLSTV